MDTDDGILNQCGLTRVASCRLKHHITVSEEKRFHPLDPHEIEEGIDHRTDEVSCALTLP